MTPSRSPTDRWIRTGMVMVTLLFGALAASTLLVSLSGGVVAGGSVAVEHNLRILAHQDGGTVAAVLVRNGDHVAKGDVLVRLDPTAARANLAATMARLIDAQIQIARLEAERDNAPDLGMPAEVAGPARTQTATVRLFAVQRHLFIARRTARLGEELMLKERAGQLEEEIRGLEAQLRSKERERALNLRELESVKGLFEKGLAHQQRFLGLEREQARLIGDVGKLTSDVSRIKGQLSEVTLKIAQTRKEFTQAVLDELRKARALAAELEEMRAALEDKLRRIEIRAPQAGRVHNMTVNGEGAVIPPAGTVLQIVPDGDRLVVEARLAPGDIDKVRAGQRTVVRFSQLDARWTPRLEGTVLKVSPAQLADANGKPYFSAQVAISQRELTRLGKGYALLPGMPADVLITTGERSILSYLVKPLADQMARAMREK
ncbi:MAG: HlyD family type I secretion periplasmic adaptor subunit [Hyphomicrobiaceae bacterium]|nr:HlyD family type I secretion periplasmic adaptor subunit [Hyphomicrobiaceae bacterium]